MIINDRDKEYSWRSKKSNPQAQIDRLIHKKDMVINLCEIKYSNIINKNISINNFLSGF